MIIFLFKNVRAVIEAEKRLVEAGLQVSIRPVPTNISSECGMCVQVSPEDADCASTLMDGNRISFKKIEIIV